MVFIFRIITLASIIVLLLLPDRTYGQGVPITSVSAGYSAAGSVDYNYSAQGSPTGTAYTPPTVYNCFFGHSGAAGNNNFTMSTTNSFVSGGNTFQHVAQADVFNIRRVDNATSTGLKDVAWYEESLPHSGTTLNHKPDYLVSNQTIMNSLNLNVGTDESFVNSSTAHFSNIERFDFVFSYGLKTHTVDNSGFAVFDRGGNDDFNIAAITAIDGSGNATGYGPFTTVSSTQWGNSAINLTYTIFSKLDSDTYFRPSNVGGPQDVKGCFVSFSDLGISNNQVVYGYCIIPGDVTAANYTDYTSYPTNSTATGNGLDLSPGGGAFCSDGNLLAAVPEICGNASDDNLDGRIDEAIPGGAADNLLLWLKADAGFSATTWIDHGPFGNDATVYGDPTLVSSALNFNDGINFDGNDHVEVSLPELAFDNGTVHLVVFAVYEPSTPSSNIGIFGNQATGSNNVVINNGDLGTGGGSGPFIPVPQLFGDSPHLISYKIDEEDNVSGSLNSSEIYINGTLVTSFLYDENNASEVNNTFYIGKTGTHGSSLFFQGDIHEVIIYYENDGNVSIDDNQRQQIESYLATKYGISLSHNYSDSQ